jgi:hypothetical protein
MAAGLAQRQQNYRLDVTAVLVPPKDVMELHRVLVRATVARDGANEPVHHAAALSRRR